MRKPSIHTSFLGIHPPKDYARGKGNECLPSALSMFVLFCFVVGCLVVVVAHQIDALLPVAGVVVVVVKEKEHRDWC